MPGTSAKPSLAGAAARHDERGDPHRGETVGLRIQLAARYRALPRAMRLQIACLAAAGVLLLAGVIRLPS
jgi:hypothetical protein